MLQVSFFLFLAAIGLSIGNLIAGNVQWWETTAMIYIAIRFLGLMVRLEFQKVLR